MRVHASNGHGFNRTAPDHIVAPYSKGSPCIENSIPPQLPVSFAIL
jgi:hypothetical protein